MKTQYAYSAIVNGLELHYQFENGSLQGRFELPPDFVVFDGHFENNPVMPGVTYILLAEIIAQTALKEKVFVRGLKRTKFFRPAFPGDMLCFAGELKPADGGVYSCVLNFSDADGQKFCSLKSQMEKR